MFNYLEQAFDAEANYNISTDFEPAISIDHVNRLAENINTLREILGITAMVPMAAGTVINRYVTTVTRGAKQPAEGEVIPLSKVEKKPGTPLTLELDFVRRITSIQAIQKKGQAIAINESDAAIVQNVRKEIVQKFFDMINAGQGAGGSAAGLQAAASQAWKTVINYYDDVDATPIFFVNPTDIADYLGAHNITTENAFGFKYLKDFMGMGTCIISPKVTPGAIFSTAVENLNGVYVPANGEVASAFDMSFDESALIGMTHGRDLTTAGIETLLIYGVLFYLENESGIFKTTITA